MSPVIPAPVTMAPGICHFLQYKAWDSEDWTATLQNVSTQIHFPGGPKSTIDPDFHHDGPWPHDSEGIGYIAWDGRHFLSKCHSHTDPASGIVTFTFEHFQESDQDNADHEDGTIGFIAWDGTQWLASAPAVGPIPDGQSIPVNFNLQRRADLSAAQLAQYELSFTAKRLFGRGKRTRRGR